MPSFTWSSAANGSWSLASNWTPSGVPGAAGGDTATINAKGTNYTVTYDESKEVLNSLTINSANATLALNASDTLTINGATNLQAGTINLLNNIDELDAGNLSTSAGTTINIGTGNKMTFNSATLGGVVDMTGTTTFGKTNASITLNGTIEVTGGIGTLDFASISGSGTLEANGATLVVESPFNGAVLPIVMSDSSSSVFETTGTLFFGETLSASFLGTHGKVEIHDAATDSNINLNISGFHAVAPSAAATNFLDLDGKAAVTVISGAGTGTTGTVKLSNNDTLNLTGITGLGPGGWKAFAQADGSGGTDIFLQSVCYFAGTMITCPDGERAVETLSIGDRVLTSDGRAMPVRWIGRNTISTKFADPLRVLPIRITAGALADHLPVRDLLVSPEHAVLVDDILIQAGALVNGLSIVRESNVAETFVYYHIELAEHALVLAEGTPAESFVDNIHRMAFDNWEEHEALYGDAPIVEMDNPRARSHRQVPMEIRARLLDRAATMPALQKDIAA